MADVEKEWKKLRGKIEIGLDKSEDLEKEVEEKEQEIITKQFTGFLSGEEIQAPVLKNENIEQEKVSSLEELGITETKKIESDFTSDKIIEDERFYSSNQENIYNQISQNVDAPVLRPRDTQPISQIPRHELLGRTSSISGIGSMERAHPEILEPEEKKEEGKRYYKLTR
jgi:hypothetical protein